MAAVLVGNAHETVPQLYNALKEGAKFGLKLIVVDPRATAPVNFADQWLQIRPGTDIALWLCWIKLIIENQWYDKEFVEEWSNSPFLVRTDTGKILRAEDLVDNVPRDAFVVWNTKSGAPAIWNAEERVYLEDGVEKALEGTFTVKLKDGSEGECKTVWTRHFERVDEWTPEKAAEVTYVPALKIV